VVQRAKLRPHKRIVPAISLYDWPSKFFASPFNTASTSLCHGEGEGGGQGDLGRVPIRELRVLRDQIYSVKLGAVKRSYVQDGNIRPGVVHEMMEENNVSIAKVSWLKKKDVAPRARRLSLFRRGSTSMLRDWQATLKNMWRGKDLCSASIVNKWVKRHMNAKLRRYAVDMPDRDITTHSALKSPNAHCAAALMRHSARTAGSSTRLHTNSHISHGNLHGACCGDDWR
jgi:hypothetical protein